MRRSEKRLFALTDELTRLREELLQTQAELEIHQHLADDAVRDAAVGGPIEREDARETGRDVERFQRLVAHLSNRVDDLEAQRIALLHEIDPSVSET